MSDKVRTIRLYGRLGSKFGRVFRMAVNSPAEAVRALCVQIPGLESYLAHGKDRGEGYAVFIGKRNLSEDELAYPAGDEDIRIAPVLLGRKSGWINVILGAVLIVAGFMMQDYTGTIAKLGMGIMSAGMGMAIGGVMQMLMPAAKHGNYDRPENQPSYVFNGSVNTQAQGNPVPVLYGELIVGSAVISAGIHVEDIYVRAPPKPGPGSGGGGGSSPWRELSNIVER